MSIADHLHVASAHLQEVYAWGVEPTPSAPADGPHLNTDGIIAFITTKIVPILLAAVGVIFISRAGKGEMSRVLTSSAIAFIGIAFVVSAVTLFAFGKALVDLILPAP